MSCIERRIEISFTHRVFFTQDVFGKGNPLLLQALTGERQGMISKVLVILDESLHSAQPDLATKIENYFKAAPGVSLVCPPVVLEGGERVKNSYFHVSEIQSQIDRYHIDRHSYIIAVGGGALLDLVGLAAATAHRGVRHVRIPTTTLGQDDSGVGVKNGINAFGKKNFIGTFAVPFAVINDFEMLASLNPRDKRAGYIEAVKVALIRDKAFFEKIERDATRLREFEPQAMQELIYRCAELHINHIATSGDPFEMGSARPLDFGHWAAHKLEQLTSHQLRHGEAVAIGIALDATYSHLSGFLAEGDWRRIIALLQALRLAVYTPELTHRIGEQPAILAGLDEFREHLGGRLTIMLLRAIGVPFDAHEIDKGVMLGSVEVLRSLADAQHSKDSDAAPISAQRQGSR